MEDTSLLVSVVFELEHESSESEVLLTGSFFDWGSPVKLQRSENTNLFHITLSLPTGIHYYKYIVDGIWTINTKHPDSMDHLGNINNCIYVEATPPLSTKITILYSPSLLIIKSREKVNKFRVRNTS